VNRVFDTCFNPHVDAPVFWIIILAKVIWRNSAMFP
jgi:hypothetical protein